MGERIEVLLKEEEITERIVELGIEITKDYEGKEVVLICVMTGAIFFFTKLAQEIELPVEDVEIDFIKVSSYGASTVSSGNVVLERDITASLEGKDVLVIEDITDTRNTVSFLKEHLGKKGANSVRICTLLDKPDRKEVDVPVDYIGFPIPDEYVFGYGLDYTKKTGNGNKQLARTKKYIGYFPKDGKK